MSQLILIVKEPDEDEQRILIPNDAAATIEAAIGQLKGHSDYIGEMTRDGSIDYDPRWKQGVYWDQVLWAKVDIEVVEVHTLKTI